MKNISNKNPSDDKGDTPIHVAAREGHLETFNVIAQMSNVLNPADNDGRTPLHYAAAMGHIHLVKDILNQVTIKNPVNNKGLTPKALFLSSNAVSENDMNDMDWE